MNNKKTAVTHPLWFIVPAAGIGQRMGANSPKQYLPLGETTILEQTLSTLLAVENVQGIVVALHLDDPYWENLSIASHPKIHTVVGGDERADSVLVALEYLQTQAQPEAWVLVHDAARPCVSVGSIQCLIENLKNEKVGGILAIPASDTLKQVSASGDIAVTLDRSVIWQAQTPQMFRFNILYSALKQSIDDTGITDEASAVEKQGHCVKIVEGSRENIKVTHPDDLWLAEAILQRSAK
jgi:2-C-methyl-D-erythritol 4-phosphate cytidylyltransferase